MVQFNKLKLTGFKSFVEHTELHIDKGLTGVIGPNGCGKSNLVEALRWVMGENSPKRMRSSGMNDVIFAGTDKRPQRNTAEVVLSVDNTDRTAPAELNCDDMLDISRKIERDVGSVYKVNGKNVRMRDVQLLFADSSIGAHSPALVSQGRVADMINAKPKQRRMVLEEAAGISGLHARRHEAELKLRSAETNLTRLEDVLGAMDFQLDSLKKQARQASRYRNLSEHIEKAESSLLYMRWIESSTAVQTALDAFNAAEEIVREKTQSVTILTTQQTEAAAELPELRKNETNAAATLQRLKLAYGSLESEERQVMEERTKSEELLRQFKEDVAHEKEQKIEATTTIERLEAEYSEIETNSQNQEERETEAKLLAEEQQQKVQKNEAELSELTEKTAQYDAVRNSTERQVYSFENRLEQLSSRKEKLEREHSELIESTPAKAELEELTSKIETADQETKNAVEIFEKTETAKAVAELAQQEANENFHGVQSSYNELKAEADALNRILRNQQSDDFEPVLDQLTVEAGIEKALAVAMGDDLQAALDGAAPIHWKELPEFTTGANLPEGVKPLSNYVEGPKALSRVLSQIGVIDDASVAEEIMQQLQPGQCLVTLDGGAWRWDGLIISPNAENSAAIRLEQKNRLADIEVEIEVLESKLTEAKETLEQAKEARSQAIDAVNTARQDLKTAESELNSLRRRHAELANELSEFNSKLSSITTSIENTEQEIEVTSTQMSEAKEALSSIPNTDEAREKITSLKEELTELRSNLAEMQAMYSEIRREGESRARRMQQIQSEINGWNSRMERVGERLEELEMRIVQAQDVITRLAERPAEIEQEKQNLMSHISEAETKRQEMADLLISSETAVNNLQRDLRDAERIMSDAKEARAMAQASVNTSQHTQHGLEEQIQEKFSCTVEALVTKFELDADKLKELEALQSKLDRLLRERDNMGPVNLRAEVETQEITEKMNEMTTERDDLTQAIDKLREGINKLNKEAKERLLVAFDTVNAHFKTLFTKLFNGGSAYMQLVQTDDPLEAGLEIFAQPPGKKNSSLSLLSGGEQTLTSIALIFAMFLTNPAPICVLDEVDAPLDESNVDRYCSLLEKLSKECKTRFIVITHHRMTMARMDRLYGVTMGERGVSQLVSVDLKQHEFDLEEAA